MPTYTNTSENNYQTPFGLLAAGEDGFEAPIELDYLEGVVKTSNLPMFNLLKARHDLEFTGAGQQEVDFTSPELIKTILISSSIPVDMLFNDATNAPAKRLLANKEYFINPNGYIDKLVFEAAAAGTVVVEEVGPQSEADENDGTTVTFGGEGVTFGGQGVTW